MAITIDNVMRQQLRESRVINQHHAAPKVESEKIDNNQQNEMLTLPEIKLHLDDILKETEIKYTLDEHDNGFIIKVMDKKTDKIIKEIPSHDIQVLRKHFKNHLGVLFNELI